MKTKKKSEQSIPETPGKKLKNTKIGLIVHAANPPLQTIYQEIRR